MQTIQKWSYFLRILFQAILIAIPIFSFINWIILDTTAYPILNSLKPNHPDLPIPEYIPYSTRWICFTISMLPNIVLIYGFYYLIKLFKLYELGKVFRIENIRYIKICAYSSLMWVILHFIANSLLILALTINNPTGQRILAVGVSTRYFSALVISIIAIVISQIMEEACKLKDENEFVI